MCLVNPFRPSGGLCPSRLSASACAAWAVALGILTEWRIRPFRADHGLGYFLGHLYELSFPTLLMIVLGAVFAFWLAAGKKPETAQKAAAQSPADSGDRG